MSALWPRMSVRLAVSVQPSDDLRLALLPLFVGGEIEAIEWTWESGLPDWLEALVAFYGSTNALYTHLVGFPLCGDGTTVARRLAEVRDWSKTAPCHVSAHFGLVQAAGFSDIAPLPVVPSTEVVTTARERLSRLRDAASCPVGVENLAFAFSSDDVARQGEMLDSILSPTDFLLLDLHNLHCQAATFGTDPVALMNRYPLDGVREIHVSGGSFSYPKVDPRPFRRDTHDGAVPEEVLELLDVAVARCPRLEVVCLERIGGSLPEDGDKGELASDFARLKARLAANRPTDRSPTSRSRDIALPSVDIRTLRRFESGLVDVLATAAGVDDARAALKNLAQNPTLSAFVDRIEPRCLEVAMELEKRWAVRSRA